MYNRIGISMQTTEKKIQKWKEFLDINSDIIKTGGRERAQGTITYDIISRRGPMLPKS